MAYYQHDAYNQYYSEPDPYTAYAPQYPPTGSSQTVDRTAAYPSHAAYPSSRSQVYPSSQSLEKRPEAVEPKAREDNLGLSQGATRGSVAAHMAAEGTIPEKAGLRMWRSDEHAGAFTRGGKARSCLRCCCCTLILVVVLLIGIVASFLLWVRPPNVRFNGVEKPSAGSQVNVISGGFQINFDLNIGVLNPNFFGAKFPSITATAFYPSNKTTPLGGGTMKDIDIKKHSNTTIHFPFMVNYTASLDPNKVIITDLAAKCGFLGSSSQSQISVDYTLELAIKIVAVTITPSFSSSTSFPCPLTKDEIASSLGIDPSDLSGLLGAISSRDLDRRPSEQTRERRRRGYAALFSRRWW